MLVKEKRLRVARRTSAGPSRPVLQRGRGLGRLGQLAWGQLHPTPPALGKDSLVFSDEPGVQNARGRDTCRVSTLHCRWVEQPWMWGCRERCESRRWQSYAQCHAIAGPTGGGAEHTATRCGCGGSGGTPRTPLCAACPSPPEVPGPAATAGETHHVGRRRVIAPPRGTTPSHPSPK